MGGTAYIPNILLTCTLFMGPLLLLFSFLNSVAIAYGSTQALPFGTICVIIIIWTLVTFPLTVIGGIAGKNSKFEFKASCRTTKYPREVPPLPWYRQTFPQMVMAGFLPFSAIYIELYYIFASIWGHKVRLKLCDMPKTCCMLSCLCTRFARVSIKIQSNLGKIAQTCCA